MLIIDAENDSAYYTDVRSLLGVTINDLEDDVLKSDMFLGAAERMICRIYAPNWQSILDGADEIASDALRSCVIIRVALNVLNMPAKQNLILDQVRLIDIILTSKKQSMKEMREWLDEMLRDQLSIAGIVHEGGWPERTVIGLSDTIVDYDYYIDRDGNIQEINAS